MQVALIKLVAKNMWKTDRKIEIYHVSKEKKSQDAAYVKRHQELG